MKKKILSLCLVVAMVATAVVGASMAFLTDEDSDVNVMTLGNVAITQNEQQRVEKAGEFTNVLEDFEQGKVLMPVTYPDNRTTDTVKIGDYTIELSDKEANYVDKIISVTNDGKSAAYVRTLVAVPTGGTDWESTPVSANNCWLHWNIPDGYGDHWTLVSSNVPMIEINGEGYYVWEFIHKTALEPGKTTYPSVRGFYMDKRVDNDDNGYFITYDNGGIKRIEDIAVGDTVNVLVLSQAVQAAGFSDATTALDEAFGDVTPEKAAAWFAGMSPVVVDTDEALAAAILDEETDYIIVNGDLTYNWGNTSYENSLAPENKTFIGMDKDASITFKGYGSANAITNVTMKNITVYDETAGDNETAWEHGHLEFNGLTAENVVFGNTIMLDGDCSLVKCSIENNTNSWYAVWVEGGNVVFEDCTFTGTRAIKIHEAYGTEVTSVVVDKCSFTLSEKPGVVIGDLNADTSVSITNSTFACKAGDQDKYIYESDTEVTTFNFTESGNTITIVE